MNIHKLDLCGIFITVLSVMFYMTSEGPGWAENSSHSTNVFESMEDGTQIISRETQDKLTNIDKMRFLWPMSNAIERAKINQADFISAKKNSERWAKRILQARWVSASDLEKQFVGICNIIEEYDAVWVRYVADGSLVQLGQTSEVLYLVVKPNSSESFDSEQKARSYVGAVIRRFLTFTNIQRAVIGPWNHGGLYHASPYLPPETPTDPSLLSQWQECIQFLDHYLKDIDNAVMTQKVLIYYTLGEEKWKTTNVWPPLKSTVQRWYLAANNSLSRSLPQTDSGDNNYAVDFEATTGKTNRWHTQLGFIVVYRNRAQEDRRLLTYTSPPLKTDTEITGYPIVTLYITSTCTDGAFFVYLEDVDETGKVTYVTEGQLRAIHRKVSKNPPPYNQLVPYHSFRKKDSMPLVPSELAELTFGLLPTSVSIKRGHSIRIAIAGHDKDTFVRIPAEETPVITVARNRTYASFVDLPITQNG